MNPTISVRHIPSYLSESAKRIHVFDLAQIYNMSLSNTVEHIVINVECSMLNNIYYGFCYWDCVLTTTVKHCYYDVFAMSLCICLITYCLLVFFPYIFLKVCWVPILKIDCLIIWVISLVITLEDELYFNFSVLDFG